MRFSLFVIGFCCVPFIMMAQSINGFILDQSSSKPLAYVNISVLNTNYGTATDSSGFFKLDISKHLNDTLLISMLGYKSEKIAVKQAAQTIKNLNIPLTKQSTVLDDVLLVSKKKQYSSAKRIGVKKQRIKFKSSVPIGYERCVFIKNENHLKGKILAVRLSLKKKTSKLYNVMPVYFRIKFYGLSNDKKHPGKLMSNFDTIIKPKNKNQKVVISVKDRLIAFPKNGVFVGVETINPYPNNPTESMYATAPNLVMTYGKKPLSFSSFRGQNWTHMTHKMRWKSFGKISYYYTNPLIKLTVKFEK